MAIRRDTARRVPTKDSRCIAYFYEIAVICIYVKKTCRSTSFLMVFHYFALITQPAAENRTITATVIPRSKSISVVSFYCPIYAPHAVFPSASMTSTRTNVSFVILKLDSVIP